MTMRKSVGLAHGRPASARLDQQALALPAREAAGQQDDHGGVRLGRCPRRRAGLPAAPGVIMARSKRFRSTPRGMATTLSGSMPCSAMTWSRVKSELAMTRSPRVITALYQRLSAELWHCRPRGRWRRRARCCCGGPERAEGRGAGPGVDQADLLARIRSERRAALPSMTSGFFDCTGIWARRPPSASSRADHAAAARGHQGAAARRTITAWATSRVVCSAPPVSSSGTTCSRVKGSGRATAF
jgi:hypothetical protein